MFKPEVDMPLSDCCGNDRGDRSHVGAFPTGHVGKCFVMQTVQGFGGTGRVGNGLRRGAKCSLHPFVLLHLSQVFFSY